MCPDWKSEKHENKAHGWSLSQKDLTAVANYYFEPKIECIVCHGNFSLQHGVKEVFLSDIPLVMHALQYNAQENGEAEVEIGQLKTIEFPMPFEDTPKVYLTPHEKPVASVPGRITNAQFTIFTCDSGTEGEPRKIGWTAYGNRAYAAIPIWRKLVSNSKEHQLRKDFRSEIVDLESAFEVFVSEYLGKSLNKRIREETISWILKRSIEEQLRIGFVELTGKPLSETESKAYSRWQSNVKELRDSIVHRGVSVTDEQAKDAREAFFDLMTKIDPTTINYFQIQVGKIREEHPSMTFGTAVLKGTK
jgi:hypothetical protein